MAKKKKRKNSTDKKKKGYYIELNGLLILLIAIIGMGRFGIVGKLISGFAIFLVGTWYQVLLIMLLLIGVYMIVKRDKPNLGNSRLVGFYFILLAVLILSHLSYLTANNLEGMEVIKETMDNFLVATKTLDNVAGGGIIGACFSVLFVSLFQMEGTKIVTATMFVFGAIMVTGISLVDSVKYIGQKLKQFWTYLTREKPKDLKEVEEEIEEEVMEQQEEEKKVVISNMEELKNNTEEKPEPKVEQPEEIVEAGEYHLPPITLLTQPKKVNNSENQKDVEKNIKKLEEVLMDFQITAKVVAVNIGPTVTQYELELKAGTKVNKILSINREIALALAATDVRIQAPIPGKNTIGIELPNKVTAMVSMRELIDKVPAKDQNKKLLVMLGKDIMGKPVFCELDKTPHLLVAGATGSGKSVCINTIINSILLRTKPDEVKLVMVDPKKVELSNYNGVPHLLIPVVTDPKKASIALQKMVSEMERRYNLFSESGTKKISDYNAWLEKHHPDQHKLPFIVVIIDELADLMLVASKEVEDSIMRITQMARAAGIHLIVATQRPSTDVITGVVKANIPSRIAFTVSSSIDSRTILDATGAEKLVGKGDMLFQMMGENIPIRVQGAFISDDEVERIINYTVKQQKAKYDEAMLNLDQHENNVSGNPGEEDASEEPLYDEIVEFVVRNQKASTSLIQRRFRIGYNRASRCMDLLEKRGIIGPQNGSRPRDVLVKLENDQEGEDE